MHIVVGGTNYTVSFGLSIGGIPNMFVARVTGAAGSKFFKALLFTMDVPIQDNYAIPVAIPANVGSVKLSFAGQGVRTTTVFRETHNTNIATVECRAMGAMLLCNEVRTPGHRSCQ